jgi:hypothetical protein
VFKALRKLEQSALPSPKLKPVKLVPKPLAIEPKAKKFRTAVLGKTHTVTNRFSKQTSIKQRVAHSSFKKLKDDKKRWNVSMRALYLRQIDDTLVLENQSPDDNDPTGINDLDAQYGSGIEGQIAYRFPNSKWSASATGRYFSEETRRIFQPLKTKNIVIGAGKLVRGVEPLFATPPGTEDLVERFNSVVTADFDARYSLGGPINSQIIAGLRVGHLDRTLNLYTAGIHSPGPPFNFQATTTENRSQFTGIGPRLGISTNIPIYGGFALQGKLGASILPGFSEVKSLNRNADASGGIGGNFPEEFEVHKTDFKVVPVFDGDLAIQYKHTFSGMDAFASLGFTTQHWLGVRDFFRTTNPTDDPRRRLKDTVVGFFGPSFKVRVAW